MYLDVEYSPDSCDECIVPRNVTVLTLLARLQRPPVAGGFWEGLFSAVVTSMM